MDKKTTVLEVQFKLTGNGDVRVKRLKVACPLCGKPNDSSFDQRIGEIVGSRFRFIDPSRVHESFVNKRLRPHSGDPIIHPPHCIFCGISFLIGLNIIIELQELARRFRERELRKKKNAVRV